MTNQLTVSHIDSANKIFVFDEVYPFRAAQEQAEKKKLNAFGMLAKLNPLNRPKENTVQLVRQELRLEPFWHIKAMRSVDYTCQLTYQVPVHNLYAQTLHIAGQDFDVARQKDKARIEFVAQETCHRKLGFDRLMDGMQRESVKSEALASFITKYKYTEVDVLERPEVLKPKLPLAGAIQLASAALTGEAINAFDVQNDQIEFERTYMYLRPVFAFEFKWSSADKVGVIEVDGLTGEVIENGHWFKDKVKDIITRETLLELGTEVAASLVPGGGVAVKIIGKITAPAKD